MPLPKSLNKSLSAVKDGVFKMTDGFLSMLGKKRTTKKAKNANNSGAYRNGYNAPITRQHAVKRENSNANNNQNGGRKRRSAAAASKRRKTKAKGGAKKSAKSKKSARSKKLSKALKTLAGLSHYYDGQHTRRSRRS